MTRYETADNPVLEPMSTDTFMQTFWERQPLHVDRQQPGYFASLLSSERIERLLSSLPFRFPDAQLVRAEEPIATEHYLDESGKVLPLRFLQHHHDGATMVLSQLHQRVEGLATLCRRMQAVLDMSCQANAYLSPAAQQGFNAHYDAHDVFILQVEGSKTFQFYAGGPELPLRGDTFDASIHYPGAATERVTLQAGDTLYIPRGVMHDARTTDNLRSLHITLGVTPDTLLATLQEALSAAATDEIALRRAVTGRSLPGLSHAGLSHAGLSPEGLSPAGPSHASLATSADLATNNTPGDNEPTSEIGNILANVFSPESLLAATRRLRARRTLQATPDCVGLVSRLAGLDQLTSSSQVTCRADAWLSIEYDDDALLLQAPGQTLRFQGAIARAVEALHAARQLAIDEIPHVDEEQRLALCRLLFRENLLELSP